MQRDPIQLIRKNNPIFSFSPRYCHYAHRLIKKPLLHLLCARIRSNKKKKKKKNVYIEFQRSQTISLIYIALFKKGVETSFVSLVVVFLILLFFKRLKAWTMVIYIVFSPQSRVGITLEVNKGYYYAFC